MAPSLLYKGKEGIFFFLNLDRSLQIFSFGRKQKANGKEKYQFLMKVIDA